MTSDSALPLPQAPGSIKHGEVLREGGVLRSVWVFSRGVFLLFDSAHVSPRQPAFCSSSPPTPPHFLLLDQASCLVPHAAPPSPFGLLPSPLKLLLFGTRSPHVRLWPEQRAIVGCHTTEHPTPETPRYQKLQPPPPPSLAARILHIWGFFFFCVCV